MYTEYSCIPSTELRREIYYVGNCKPFSLWLYRLLLQVFFHS
jgi:hypothetical protein